MVNSALIGGYHRSFTVKSSPIERTTGRTGLRLWDGLLLLVAEFAVRELQVKVATAAGNSRTALSRKRPKAPSSLGRTEELAEEKRAEILFAALTTEAEDCLADYALACGEGGEGGDAERLETSVPCYNGGVW